MVVAALQRQQYIISITPPDFVSQSAVSFIVIISNFSLSVYRILSLSLVGAFHHSSINCGYHISLSNLSHQHSSSAGKERNIPFLIYHIIPTILLFSLSLYSRSLISNISPLLETSSVVNRRNFSKEVP